jgi:hypothetical protein
VLEFGDLPTSRVQPAFDNFIELLMEKKSNAVDIRSGGCTISVSVAAGLLDSGAASNEGGSFNRSSMRLKDNALVRRDTAIRA